MRILALALRNYRVFEEVDLELPSRVIGVFGANGSGKSSLLEAILWACYGRARTPKDQIRTHGILEDCAVDLAFEHGGSEYRVRRTIKGKGHQTEAELFVGDRQLATGVSEVAAEVERLLGMDQHVFRASVFAEQKQLDAFSDVSKGKRKEMVLRLLGIRPVDDARTAARKKARDTADDAGRLAGALPDLADLEGQVPALQAASEEAGTAAAEASEALEAAEERAGEAAEAFEASDRVRERVDRIGAERSSKEEEAGRLEAEHADLEERIRETRARLEDLPALKAEVADLAGAEEAHRNGLRWHEEASEVRGLEERLTALPEVDAEAAGGALRSAESELSEAVKAAARTEAQATTARAALAAAREALDHAGELDPSAPCPTCGQELGARFERVVEHRRQEVTALEPEEARAAEAQRRAESARRAAEERASATRAEAERAREAASARAELEGRLAEHRARLGALAEPFRGEVPDLAALEARADRGREVGHLLAELRAVAGHLEQSERDLSRTATALGSCRARIAALDKEAAGLGFEPEEHARRRKEREESLALLDVARQADREAARTLADAERQLGELEARIAQARETASKVDELREDARYLDRVSGLLDGFRDHLVARIGPELSREAEAVFRELTGAEYEAMKIDEETLAIQIADGADWFSIERFSGSEADLANLALRVAISTHLSSMSGADVGMVVLDEVLGSLDQDRKDLFVQAMGRLAGRFHQLFVVTHAEQLKDQFPASIEVRRVGRRRSEAVLR